MKIQKQLSKKTKEKNYFRYAINIPEGIIKKAELKEGDELKAEAKKGEIKLKLL